MVKLIASTCLDYNPKSDEIVHYFGKFSENYESNHSRKKYYHVKHFEAKYDQYIFHKCWRPIGQIYIMGLEDKHNNYYDTLIQLCKMNAPLHRVYRYKAIKDKDDMSAYIGATQNHTDCILDMISNGYNNCLFLEDDFLFTDTVRDNQKMLHTFWKRKYQFDIVFLAASKLHERRHFDDLLINSYQECTTSSGYILNKKTVQRVYEVVKEGLEKMKVNPQNRDFCIDRYWRRLQSGDKVFIFKRKLGFQKPSYSELKKSVAIFLD